MLLLDEPTEPSRHRVPGGVEEALAQYPGTLVMVSLDRTLIDKMADRLVVFETDRVVTHLGNYTDYREQRERQAGTVDERPTTPRSAGSSAETRQGRGTRTAPAAKDLDD